MKDNTKITINISIFVILILLFLIMVPTYRYNYIVGIFMIVLSIINYSLKKGLLLFRGWNYEGPVPEKLREIITTTLLTLGIFLIITSLFTIK